MFWKKKAEEDIELKHIKAPADSRQAYRINPTTDDPIIVHSVKESYEVMDISSGGLSVYSKTLKVENELDVEFSLPISLEKIVTRLKVLKLGKKNVCHCQFISLSQDMEDKIHKYVLERQKEDLRF